MEECSSLLSSVLLVFMIYCQTQPNPDQKKLGQQKESMISAETTEQAFHHHKQCSFSHHLKASISDVSEV